MGPGCLDKIGSLPYPDLTELGQNLTGMVCGLGRALAGALPGCWPGPCGVLVACCIATAG